MDTKTKESLQEGLLPKQVSEDTSQRESLFDKNDPSDVWPQVSSVEVLPGDNLRTIEKVLTRVDPWDEKFNNEENETAIAHCQS